MPTVIFRQKAIDDLSEIWNYTVTKWSESQADKHIMTIKYACNKIGENPRIGRSYSEIHDHLYGFKIGKHIIFYSFTKAHQIEVIRILHENMDVKYRINK